MKFQMTNSETVKNDILSPFTESLEIMNIFNIVMKKEALNGAISKVYDWFQC